MSASRRLVAILAVDVIGYSPLRGRTRRGGGSLTKPTPRAACHVQLPARTECGDASPEEIVSLRCQEAHRGCAERRAPLARFGSTQPQHEGRPSPLNDAEAGNIAAKGELLHVRTERGCRFIRLYGLN